MLKWLAHIYQSKQLYSKMNRIFNFLSCFLITSIAFSQYAEARVSPRQLHSCVTINDQEHCKIRIQGFNNGKQLLKVAIYRGQQILDEITILLRSQYDYSRETDRQIIGIKGSNYNHTSRVLTVELVGKATPSIYYFKIDNDGHILHVSS